MLQGLSTSPHIATPELAFSDHTPTSLDLYRWINPQTDCMYPFLAIARDRSTSLLLGNYEACFELIPSHETKRWLPGFASTRRRVTIELAGLCNFARVLSADSADYAIVQFDEQLLVIGFKLVFLSDDGESASRAEYRIHAFGDYERWESESDACYRVSAAEKALLHLCCATFQPLTKRVPHELRALPPPGYR